MAISRNISPGTVSRWALLPLGLTAGLALASSGHDLTFQGDASFGGPHGGQMVSAALVEVDSGEVVAKASETISAEDPAFSFRFEHALHEGTDYEVHYWIDSNFGGGTEGSCDPMTNDHQWAVSLGDIMGDVSHVESHNPGTQTSVCDTFSTM